MHRLLPTVVLVILTFFLAFNFQAIRREIAYGLGISGDSTHSCCSEQEILNSSGEFDETATTAIFNNEEVNYPKTSLAYDFVPAINPQPGGKVLGTHNATGEEKWIEVSLEQQKLRAWEGDKIVMEFPISSGKWAKTPKGDYNIWYKTRRQTMKGGSKELGTYYYLPNVPHNMFFYQGYAIHGAYWHNNFGNPMSHGCVNAPLANVAALFEWTGPVVPPDKNFVKASPDNPGTRVYIH